MPLDYEKVKAASLLELAALAVCEFSRFVDAIERIAPDANPLPAEEGTEPVACPHPADLRTNMAAMGQEPFSIYYCGACRETITRAEGEA